jgi:hypothetical protein
LETFNKDPNFAYRYCDVEVENLERKQKEGWEFCNPTTDSNVKTDAEEELNTIAGGKRYRRLVLMRMPMEKFRARAAYFQELTEKQTRGLKQNLEKQAADSGAEVHGKIVID